MKRAWWREGLVLGLVLLALWLPRGLELNRFVTVDERLWLTRSANFYCALSRGELAETFQSEHPGVTTMYAGMLGFLWEAPTYREGCASDVDAKDHESVLRERGFDPVTLLAAGRFFVVLEVVLALGAAFLYARRLLGVLPAAVGFLLIAFDPFFVAHTRLLHLDGLLSSFMLLSLLAFLGYLQDRRLRDLIVSGIAAGLSWLTKSPGFFLIPFMGLLLVWEPVRAFRKEAKISFGDLRSGFVFPWVIWLCLGGIMFVLLWPALWHDPLSVLSKMLEAAEEYAAEGHSHSLFFRGRVFEDGRLGANFYPLTFLWRSTPVVWIGCLLASGVLGLYGLRTLQKKSVQEPAAGIQALVASHSVPMVMSLIFVGLFTVALSIGTKKFDRYVLPIYPVLDLVAGMGWSWLVRWLWNSEAKRRRTIAYPLAAMAALAQLFPVITTFPYYLSYYNPWMGGSRKAPEVMQIGWGEGLDQAAAYLNEKPGAENLRVLSWYEPACFSYFFKGTSDKIGGEYKFDPDDEAGLFDFDYAVIYIHQWQQQRPPHLLDYLALGEPEHSIWINGLEYARIYRLSDYRAFYQDPSYRQVDVRVGEQIVLEGYALPQPEAKPGESIPVALSWRAVDVPTERLKVFVYLLNAARELVSQSDSEPMMAFRPTDTWRVGEQIADHYRVVVPEGLASGIYTLKVGMYQASGERLALEQGGEPIGDALTLGTIEVMEP